MSKVQILTSEPREVAPGMQLVSFARKSTKQNPVAEADKYRAVIVPQWIGFPTVAHSEQNVVSVFAAAIEETAKFAASEILRTFVDENSKATEFEADSLLFAAVVAKMQEQQTSQRLNSEQISNWYDASSTKEDAIERYGDSEKGKKQCAALRDKYLSLASNNPAVSPALAEKMLAYINEADLTHPVAKAVIKRCERLQQAAIDADEL